MRPSFSKAADSLLPSRGEGVLLLFALGLLAGLGLAAAPKLSPMPAKNDLVFSYTFNSPGTLEEEGSMEESSSPYFWLNSGGRLIIQNGVGSTIEGALPASDRWYQEYAATNAEDTDGGAHPQNIFRLVTKTQWQDVAAQASFKIDADNLSSSHNRNASNGLLLMNRYADDGQTLYYAGVRVDGTAVIKKKYKGTYYTMAQDPVFDGTYNGEVDDKNLIPHGQWLGLKTEVVTSTTTGAVTVSLYMKREDETQWSKILEAEDSGQYDRTPPITAPGYEGIRTDFMDVEFKDYRLEKIVM